MAGAVLFLREETFIESLFTAIRRGKHLNYSMLEKSLWNKLSIKHIYSRLYLGYTIVNYVGVKVIVRFGISKLLVSKLNAVHFR